MVFSKKEPKEDTRSALGRRADYLCGLILIWLASFILLASLTGKPVTSLFISVPLLVIEAVLLRQWRRVTYSKQQQRKRRWQSGNKILKTVMEMDTRNDFIIFVRDILAKLPGFQMVSRKKSQSDESDGRDEDIDLEFVYQGIPVAVACAHQINEQKITPDQVRSFAAALHQQGYQHGLLFTTGDCLPGVARVISAASRQGVRIGIVNRDGLINLALRAGAAASPAAENDPGQSPAPAARRHAALITVLEETIFNYGKAKHYFLFGLLLYGGYFFMRGGSSLLSLLYLSFALFNILLGIACLFWGREAREADPLKGLRLEKR